MKPNNPHCIEQVQLVCGGRLAWTRTPAFQAGDPGFKSRPPHHLFSLSTSTTTTTKTATDSIETYINEGTKTSMHGAATRGPDRSSMSGWLSAAGGRGQTICQLAHYHFSNMFITISWGSLFHHRNIFDPYFFFSCTLGLFLI